jgi:hypothetical protein
MGTKLSLSSTPSETFSARRSAKQLLEIYAYMEAASVYLDALGLAKN